MIMFLRKHLLFIIVSVLIAAAFFIWQKTKNNEPTWITDAVSTGTVRNIISVSGSIDAVSTADLAFSTGGILESIAVTEGATVTSEQILATLIHTDLLADAQDAEAALLITQSDRDELVNGITDEAKNVSRTNVSIAQEDLTRITNEQNDRVKNAYRTLLSSDLEARPIKDDNDNTPPLVTGTYTCGEGAYTLEIFGSGAQSGYSYRLLGLETGTYTGYTETAAPIGVCGLRIQFSEGENYGNESWIIEIPNKQSSFYLANQNAYTLTLTQRTNAIHEAEQKLKLAEQNNTLTTVAPRIEELTRADAKITQAEARIASIRAQIQDHILKAPFDGTVTNVEPVVGEAVSTLPIITMVSNDTFALTALIPEIDITKIYTGQKAEVTFDARDREILPATVVFISPLAKEIDGVSYFEAKLTLDNHIEWIRSGLNADIDIILEAHENVTRIPKRYLSGSEGAYSVLVPNGTTAVSKTVTVPFVGNDGFVEVSGIENGSTIIAP